MQSIFETKYLMPERSLGLSLLAWHSWMQGRVRATLRYTKIQETDLPQYVSLGIQQILDLQMFPARILDIVKLFLHHSKSKMIQS